MALPGVAILSAAQPQLSHHAPLSQRGMPLLCSLAMHGLLFAAALWLSLPKPSHAPRPEPFMTVQFVAAPPAPVAVSAPAQAVAPPPPVLEPETSVREVTPEPAVEAPPPLVTQSAADSVPPPPPRMAPQPVVKPKPQSRVAARPPEAKPVETKPVETKPVETKPVEAPPSEVAAVPQPVPQRMEAPPAMAAPAATQAPVAAPAAIAAAAPAEIQSNEPPVLRHPGFRNRPQPPVYPVRARQMEQEGVSVVRALIDPEGQSREVRLWRSSGYEMLDQAALNAVRGWAFNAARVGDRPVLAWVEIPVQFKLR